GGAVLAGSVAFSWLDGTTWGDVLGELVFLLLVVGLAVVLRARAAARFQELDKVRLLEREQLARDLHDTVAHHVSAIAIRAQAGLAVAVQNPGAAADALSVIEAEASRTLTEMRLMVRVLRQGDAVDLAPSARISDIRELAGDGRSTPTVEVTITGNDEQVPLTVAAAVYRLAQESVTNARRHARNASRIDVLVEVHADGVRLSVHDDGEAAPGSAPGFGLIGMRERVALFGGTLTAGRKPGGGWAVEASLPRVGWST
ncbi:MAG TPA: histidine kinase, partial [Naasia sp.]